MESDPFEKLYKKLKQRRKEEIKALESKLSSQGIFGLQAREKVVDLAHVHREKLMKFIELRGSIMETRAHPEGISNCGNERGALDEYGDLGSYSPYFINRTLTEQEWVDYMFPGTMDEGTNDRLPFMPEFVCFPIARDSIKNLYKDTVPGEITDLMETISDLVGLSQFKSLNYASEKQLTILLSDLESFVDLSTHEILQFMRPSIQMIRNIGETLNSAQGNAVRLFQKHFDNDNVPQIAKWETIDDLAKAALDTIVSGNGILGEVFPNESNKKVSHCGGYGNAALLFAVTYMTKEVPTFQKPSLENISRDITTLLNYHTDIVMSCIEKEDRYKVGLVASLKPLRSLKKQSGKGLTTKQVEFARELINQYMYSLTEKTTPEHRKALTHAYVKFEQR